MLPKYRRPTHPGEILKEEVLLPLEEKQTTLAERRGCPPAKINEIVNKKRGVTPETALSLADIFGTTPEFWSNLQSNYDLWGAMQKHQKLPPLLKRA